MKQPKYKTIAAMLGFACIAMLATGCVYRPNLHKISQSVVEAKYPQWSVQQIDNYAMLLQGPSRWLLTNGEEIKIVWVSDKSKITHEQNFKR